MPTLRFLKIKVSSKVRLSQKGTKVQKQCDVIETTFYSEPEILAFDWKMVTRGSFTNAFC